MKTILKEILKEQKKTNKMLQTIVSSLEQKEIIYTSKGNYIDDGPKIKKPF